MKTILLLFLAFISPFIYGQNNQTSVLKNPTKFNNLIQENNVWNKQIFIGNSKTGKPIYGYYFNNGGIDKAMIIAGVHGSEFYGVDLALKVRDSLTNLKVKKCSWKILIIPELFTDNVKLGRDHIFETNYGRSTCTQCKGQNPKCEYCTDPNRQMPSFEKEYIIGQDSSFNNKKIEIENQYLLFITQKFKPSRIASLHCKNSELKEEIGIYADPRTDNKNIVKDYSTDALLTIKMAFLVLNNGGIIYGNFPKTQNYSFDFFDYEGKNKISVERFDNFKYVSALYPQDSKISIENKKQKRSYEENAEKGISFGTWASTDIVKSKKLIKKASTILTFELPQYKMFFSQNDDKTSLNKKLLELNTQAYLKSIIVGFLDIK